MTTRKHQPPARRSATGSSAVNIYLDRVERINGNAHSEARLVAQSKELVKMMSDGKITEEQTRTGIAHLVVRYLGRHPGIAGPRHEEVRLTAIRIAVAYVTKTPLRTGDVGRELKSWLDLDRIDLMPQWLWSVVRSSAHQVAPKISAVSVDALDDAGVSGVRPVAESAEETVMASLDSGRQERCSELLDEIAEHPSKMKLQAAAIEVLDLPPVVVPSERKSRYARRCAKTVSGWHPLIEGIMLRRDIKMLREVTPFWAGLEDELVMATCQRALEDWSPDQVEAVFDLLSAR
jgi:hypothetical protein